MDAGLAKVMNSSVGSSALKALDTILKTDNTTIANNAADRLFNSLKNSVKLVASDETMFAYNGTWGHFNIDGKEFTNKGTLQFMQFDKSGTVRFALVFTNEHSSASYEQAIYVVDSSHKTIAKSDLITVAPKTTVLIWVDANVVAGGKYKCAFENSSYLQVLNVCATPVLFGATATLTS